MMVQRKTATKYLDMIVEVGLLEKIKIWKTNYYINTALMDLFVNRRIEPEQKAETIESVHSAQ